MVLGRRLAVWSISSWTLLLLISCVHHVAETRLAKEPFSQDTNAIRSLIQQRPESSLVTNWLANVVNERLPDITGKSPLWLRKSEGNYLKSNKVDKEGRRRAVCTLQSSNPDSINVIGVIELTQPGPNEPVVISGVVTASTEQNVTGNHGFHIHQLAVPQSGECTATGGHYNPEGKDHGAPDAETRHVGDLGNIMMNKVEDGLYNSDVEITDSQVTLFGDYSVDRRAIVLHEGEDDLGLGGKDDSLTTGHAGARIACCTINMVPLEDVIKFNSIRGFVDDNVTMVELEVKAEGDFEVNNLTFIYNGDEQRQVLSSSWAGESRKFNFEADIFESENIQLSLLGRKDDLPVTASGSVTFNFEDPEVQMAFVGSDTKTSIRIAGEVPDSGISGSVKCAPNIINDNSTACYILEKDGSYCKTVTTDEGSDLTVCDSSRYIDPLNEVSEGLDLMWMEMEMPMDRMDMTMPMLMVTASFSETPAKMEVLIYADDDPSKIYSPLDWSCEIQHHHHDKMNMDGTMCHQMLPEDIPSNQEGVQVLAVGLDENGNVIGSGIAHSIVNEDFTAIIVGSCLAAVVGTACIVALVGCYVEKKKKKKLQDELHGSSAPKL